MASFDGSEPPRRNEHPGDGAARGTARMEAFADAVFAIAFTLPIVEIRLPEADKDFGAELIALWPEWLGYFLASLVIGIYWVQHHFSGAIYRTTGHRFLLATLLFLAAIGFIAFPTRAFTDSLTHGDAIEAGGMFYSLALCGTAVSWWIKWRTGLGMGEVDARLEPAYVRRLDRTYTISTGLMLAAAVLTMVRWEAGLCLAALVTLFYLRPPPTPRYRADAPVVEGEG